MGGERLVERRKAHGHDVLRHEGAHLPYVPVRGLQAEEVHEVRVEVAGRQLACSALQIQALHQEHVGWVFGAEDPRLICSERSGGGGGRG